MTAAAVTPEERRAALRAYLKDQADARERRLAAMSDALTDRERALVREAAVMGWVQGTRHADVDIPQDTTILRIVLSACDAFNDLYPTIAALGGTPTEGL